MVHTGGRFGDRGSDKGALRMPLGGFTPLLFAARVGDIASASVLLDAGAKVEDVALDGASALAVAALSGHGAFAAFLLDKGADPNAAGAGYTAVHAPVLPGHPRFIPAVVQSRARPDT